LPPSGRRDDFVLRAGRVDPVSEGPIPNESPAELTAPATMNEAKARAGRLGGLARAARMDAAARSAHGRLMRLAQLARVRAARRVSGEAGAE